LRVTLFRKSTAEAYEIIYVDDGSNDRTAAVLKQALREFKRLRVIRHQQSCGQSTAIHTGVKAANYLRAGGHVISEPVNHRSWTNGYSKYGTLDRLWAGIIDLSGVIWLQKRAKPPVIKEVEDD
jgi:hypothetical protein